MQFQGPTSGPSESRIRHLGPSSQGRDQVIKADQRWASGPSKSGVLVGHFGPPDWKGRGRVFKAEWRRAAGPSKSGIKRVGPS
jgi:hypothetical protein